MRYFIGNVRDGRRLRRAINVREVLAVLEEHPEWVEIMQQKTI